MTNLFRKGLVVAGLAASALAVAAPAEARGYRHHDGGDDAAIAIGAGIIGLAIGAAIASDRDDDRYYDDGYYYRDYPRYRGSYQYRSYPQYYRYEYRDRRDWRRDRGWRGDRGRHHRHRD